MINIHDTRCQHHNYSRNADAKKTVMDGWVGWWWSVCNLGQSTGFSDLGNGLWFWGILEEGGGVVAYGALFGGDF